MKKVLGILLLSFIVLALVACSESKNKKDIKVFVKEYKTAQYTINNPTQLSEKHPVEISNLFSEKVKPYLSDDELENLINNRFFVFTLTVANAVSKKVKLEDVILEKVEVNEDGSIDYDYKLKLNYYDDESSEIIEKEGELTIINDDGLMITRDWEKPNEFEREAIRNLH